MWWYCLQCSFNNISINITNFISAMAFYGIRFWGCASNCFATFRLMHPCWSLGVLLPCITGLFYLQEAETGPLVVPPLITLWLICMSPFSLFIINTVAYAYSDHSLVCQTSARWGQAPTRLLPLCPSLGAREPTFHDFLFLCFCVRYLLRCTYFFDFMT